MIGPFKLKNKSLLTNFRKEKLTLFEKALKLYEGHLDIYISPYATDTVGNLLPDYYSLHTKSEKWIMHLFGMFLRKSLNNQNLQNQVI